MQIIVKLETSIGKTIKERINAKSTDFAELIALRKNKNSTILTSFIDNKHVHKSMLKDRW